MVSHSCYKSALLTANFSPLDVTTAVYFLGGVGDFMNLGGVGDFTPRDGVGVGDFGVGVGDLGTGVGDLGTGVEAGVEPGLFTDGAGV